MNLILTDNELYRLTLYRQGAKQAELLVEWGIPFVMGRDGRPRVLRADVEQRRGVRPQGVEEAATG